MEKVIPSPVLYILLSLAEEDRHGYAIMLNIRERTNGRVVLGPGGLYTSLQRALRNGYIREVPVRAGQAANARGRRAYRLTPQGRKAVQKELARLEDVMHIARGANLTAAADA